MCHCENPHNPDNVDCREHKNCEGGPHAAGVAMEHNHSFQECHNER